MGDQVEGFYLHSRPWGIGLVAAGQGHGVGVNGTAKEEARKGRVKEMVEGKGDDEI